MHASRTVGYEAVPLPVRKSDGALLDLLKALPQIRFAVVYLRTYVYYLRVCRCVQVFSAAAQLFQNT